MIITCDHCGLEIDKYEIIGYKKEYLERLLSNYFGNPLRDLVSINIKSSKNGDVKKVCISILLKHSTHSAYSIKKEYKFTGNPYLYIKEMKKKKNVDFIQLDTILSKTIANPNKSHQCR